MQPTKSRRAKANQPSKGIKAWNAPKEKAILNASFPLLLLNAVAEATETLKASMASPKAIAKSARGSKGTTFRRCAFALKGFYV